jgi:hypothetical protein
VWVDLVEEATLDGAAMSLAQALAHPRDHGSAHQVED